MISRVACDFMFEHQRLDFADRQCLSATIADRRERCLGFRHCGVERIRGDMYEGFRGIERKIRWSTICKGHDGEAEAEVSNLA